MVSKYLIKWARYNDSENIWEFSENCERFKDFIKKFHLQNSNHSKPEDPPPQRKKDQPRKNSRKRGRRDSQAN